VSTYQADIKKIAAAAIAAFVLAVAADATGFADDLVDGDWSALHTVAVTALAAAYEAAGAALRDLLDKAFPGG